MTAHKANPDKLTELRKQAEARLKKHPPVIHELSMQEVRELVHELQTYQIELEIQNEALLSIQEELAESRDRFSDLYDQAPAGYVTINNSGLILEANLTLAEMLGVERQTLVKQPFSTFIFPNDQDIFYLHYREIQDKNQPCMCRLRMLKRDAEPLWVQIESVLTETENKSETRLRAVISDATVRKRVEKKLKESEKRLRNVLETVDLIAISLDTQGNITFCNDCLLNMTGWKREEIIGKSWFKTFLPPEIQDEIKWSIFLETIKTSNFPAHYTNEIITRNGDRRLISWSNTVFHDPNGDVAGATSIGEDITDRTLAERALRESEDKYRNIYENALEGFYQSIPGGRFISVNPAFASMLGYESPKDLLSAISDITTQYYVNPEDRHVFQQILRKNGKIENFEFKARRKDGSSIWVSNSTRAYFDADGKVVRYEGIVNDISKRKEFEVDRERLTSAIQQMSESVVITDAEGTIVYVNPSFERLTGYSHHEAIGQNPRILNSGHHDDNFYRELWETISSGNVWGGQIINRNKSGTLFTEQATISPVLDQDGKIENFIAVKKDMTQQIRSDEEKNQLQEQLQQAQKVEAIGSLAGGVAHDFNNLLSIILGYSESVLDELHPGDPLREDMKEIIEAGRRSATLTRQLLAFSRRQTLQPMVLNLNDIISNLEKMLGRLIGEDIELSLSLSKNLNHVIADPGQIEQVIMNIAVNARDAMPTGGKLIIETANVELDEAYADGHPGVLPGKYVMCAINDTGSGMNKDTLLRVFEPFFTTKDKDRGTGLGLSTVYGIVKQSGGNIWAYSEPGFGTTFKIYLPETNSEKNIEKKRPARKTIKTGDEYILVVEDEEAVRNLMMKALLKYGYHVDVAENGEAALLKVEEKGLKPDLVITDIVLPGMSGTELIGRLREKQPNLKELLMSGYTDDAIGHHWEIHPDTPFIQKPFSIREIIHKVQELLR